MMHGVMQQRKDALAVSGVLMPWVCDAGGSSNVDAPSSSRPLLACSPAGTYSLFLLQLLQLLLRGLQCCHILLQRGQ